MVRKTRVSLVIYFLIVQIVFNVGEFRNSLSASFGLCPGMDKYVVLIGVIF